ncbi:MAG: aminoglycoside phosphotransferase family protein, partial [Chloroflexota bacterium]
MSTLPPRIATLVLVTGDGELVGSLPPIPVSTPWWPDAEPVVRAARERFGVDVTVLRLLEAELEGARGGAVTYLCEVAGPVREARPWSGRVDEHPLRQPWARPGGPAADLDWADGVLVERGLRRSGPAIQARTWNLSSLWCLPLADGAAGGAAWLKVVPSFFAHEGAILERLQSGPVPTLLGRDGPRVLMAEIPGQDLYDAALPTLTELVSCLVDVQRSWIGRVEELIALGLPDWRDPALSEAIAAAVERTTAELAAHERAILESFVADLPRLFAALAECGLPDTLVHGDFHPGSARGDGRTVTLLDWGDSGVGHPLLDQAAYFERMPNESLEAVRDHWRQKWLAAVPGSDPARAGELIAPVAAARQAVIYWRFLDGIEPSEWPYHRADPAIWLRQTAEL